MHSASEYSRLPGYNAWLSDNPEPILEQGLLQHEYDARLKQHAVWSKKRAEFFFRVRPVAQAPSAEIPAPIDEPLELDTGSALFPVEVLPDEVRIWAQAQAEFCQVPVTLAASCALMAVMTAAIHLNVLLAGNEDNGWMPPLVSQMMVVSPSGTRKSPVMRAAFAPLFAWEADEKKRFDAEISQIKTEIAELTVDAEGQAIAIKSGTPEARRLADLKKDLEKVPPPRRLIAMDITPEKHMRVMAENDGTIALVDAEGDIMGPFLGRYSNSDPKLTALLKGWDGDTVLYERVGSGGGKAAVDVRIESARAGISITTQHTVMNSMLKDATLRNKGLLARWLYVVMPPRGWKPELHPESPKPGVKSEYRQALLRLRALSAEQPLRLANAVDYGRGWAEPAWFTKLRERCRDGEIEGGEFSHMVDWSSKFPDNMARVAAALEAMGGGGEENLTALSEFFISHAKKFFGSPDVAAPERSTELEKLADLRARIAKKWPARPRLAGDTSPSLSAVFTIREVQRLYKSSAGMSSERVSELLDKLMERGDVAEAPAEDMPRLKNKAFARRFVLVHSGKAPAAPAQVADDDRPRGQPLPFGARAPIETDDWGFQDGIDG